MNPKLSRSELRKLTARAAANARALGLSADEWQERRMIEGTPAADILMAIDPEPIPPPAGRTRRPHRRKSLAMLAGMYREAARDRDTAALRAVCEELGRRRMGEAETRLRAAVRLALLALGRPEALPFSVVM